MAAQTVAVKVHALIGEWEGESFVLLGAVDLDVYESEPDAEWQDRLRRWNRDFTGITDTKEVALSIEIPLDFFDPPQLTAEPLSQSERSE